MKNSKFNPLFESIYSRFKDGNGFLAGDVVKFKSDYKNLEHFKKLGENIRQRIDDMIKTGNNIRIGRLHNQDSAYGAFGGSSFPACHADLYEEVAPSFWRNLVTVPVELIETNNPAIDLPPVPEGQKDKQRAYQKPVEAKSDKPNKGPEINEQTKTGKKQTHADKGDYELATKNTKLANSNKYNDAEPPKVKGAKKPKELKESVEDVYGKMLTEGFGDYPAGTSDNPITGHPDNPSYNYRKNPFKAYTNVPVTKPEHETITPELKQRIVDTWNSSKKNAAEIAQELGVKPNTVSRVLSDVGILPEDAEGAEQAPGLEKIPAEQPVSKPLPTYLLSNPKFVQLAKLYKGREKGVDQLVRDLYVNNPEIGKHLISFLKQYNQSNMTEDAEGPQTWTDEDVGAMGSGSNAESVKNEEITVADESGLQAYLGKKKYGAKDFKALQKAGRDHNEKKKEEIKAKHSKADSKQ